MESARVVKVENGFILILEGTEYGRIGKQYVFSSTKELARHIESFGVSEVVEAKKEELESPLVNCGSCKHTHVDESELPCKSCSRMHSDVSAPGVKNNWEPMQVDNGK